MLEEPMRNIHPVATALTAAVLAASAVSPLDAQAPGDEIHPSARHSFRVTTVAEGFDHPWSIAWLPTGEMLVTERAGRLRIVRDGKLDPEPIGGLPQARVRGQGGLLDVVPHPDFASNRLLYLSYAKPGETDALGTTAVVRGRLEGNRLVGVEEIFVARAWAETNPHFAGRMAFDRDRYLFVSVGDRGASPNLMERHPAQDLSNHQGKIVRLHDDGRVPADNPFVGHRDALPEIWSYGHRNPQGLAFHPTTGQLWSNEHGPRGGDELNLILPGLNYGWPVVSHGINYDGSVYTRETHRDGMESPRWVWTPSIATSGLVIYSGDAFPWWRDGIFVGGMIGEQLARLTLNGERIESQEVLLDGRLGRIRDVRQGPDGLLYLALDDRSGQTMTAVVRLEPTTGPVAAPR